MIPKAYYRLTKPGIVYGNSLPAIAGYLLGAKGQIDLLHMVGTIVGLALVIGSACVLNNYFDRQIDAKMSRTSNREFVTGKVSPLKALIFCITLGLVGFVMLGFASNKPAVAAAIFGYVDYVLIYTFSKRRSQLSTVLGSLSGAVPPVVGYLAIGGQWDNVAWLLFISMALWQMPHFYAIGLYRKKEYEAAGLPILTVKRSVLAARLQITVFILAFGLASLALGFAAHASKAYMVLISGLNIYWFWRAINFPNQKSNTEYNRWARGIFKWSLIIMVSWSVLLGLNYWLSY